MKKAIILFSLIIGFAVQAQKPKRILLNNGFLHIGNGEVMSNAAIGIEGEKIIFVKNALAYTIRKKEWDTVIELNNQHVYPGFVAPNSTLGLTEIESVRATNDFEEVGELNPHIRSLIAYNMDSRIIPTVRANGVLLTQACPRGGAISGTSSVMHLGGWNWEDAAVKADDGIHVNWPDVFSSNRWDRRSKKKNEKYDELVRELTDFFNASKAYLENDKPVLDLRYQAMREVFKGTKRVYFHADQIQQLLDILEFSKKMGIKFPVIVGGYDSYLITERLRDASVPVMLTKPHSLPENEDDPVDLPYRLPYLLQQGGVKFCLQNEGDMEAPNARNLPFMAGTARAYGLSDEEAIRSISLNACEIMGIEKQYGSVEVGKQATLFVSKGDALEMMTNQLSLILMDGEIFDSNTHQTELYEKYQKKYGIK